MGGIISYTTMEMIADCYKDIKKEQKDIIDRLDRLEKLILTNSIYGLTISFNEEQILRKD